MDARTLAKVFAWLRPDDLIWNYWVNNYLQGNTPPALDILSWNADATSMPAGLHRNFIDIAMTNALTKPGASSMLGFPSIWNGAVAAPPSGDQHRERRLQLLAGLGVAACVVETPWTGRAA